MTNNIKKSNVEKDREFNHESFFKDYLMVPEIIFAIRFCSESGWEINAWECTYDELIDEIGMIDFVFDFAILLEHEVIKGLNGYLLKDVAYSQNWLFDQKMDHWLPMPDPSEDHWLPGNSGLNAPDNKTTPAKIKLSLISIDAGIIYIAAEGPESTVSIQLCSTQDDLTDLIRFFNVLSSGLTPHLVFNGRGMNVVTTIPQLGNKIRLHVSHVEQEGSVELIDIIILRKQLLSEIKGLANSIANHPSLADEWFCCDEIYGIDGLYVVEQLKSALSVSDLRFIGSAYKTKIQLSRVEVFNQKLLDAATNNLINEGESDSQGKFFKLAILEEGGEGWKCFSSIKSPADFLKACVEEGQKIVSSRIICEYRARPLLYPEFCFDHLPENYEKGWKRDRFHQCWRAPNEEIKMPTWSIPEEELQRREKGLKTVEPTLTKYILKIYNQDKVLIHSEEKSAVGFFDPLVKNVDFYGGIGKYAESHGLIHGPFTSIRTVFLEVLGEMLNYSELHQSLKKSGNEWKVERINSPSRNKPLIKVEPVCVSIFDADMLGEWGKNITRYGVYYPFQDFPDLKLVETILEEEWLPQLNCAKEIDDKGTLDLNWDDFHKQGLELAFRLKAILGDRADIVYEKSYADPNYKVEKTRFIL